MRTGASSRTAEQKSDLTADRDCTMHKSCGLHQGTGAVGRGGREEVSLSGHEGAEQARLASGD